jgi:tetratricopeptide (TPR) repeat protein
VQFRAAVKAGPKDPNVHFGLGYLLWTQRQFEEAAAEFRTELENNPNYAQAMTYLADTEMQLKHPELALPLLENALRIASDNQMAHLDLGIVYADLGRKDDAVRELKEAARLAPEDVNVHWRLGRLYRSMGKNDEAKAELEKASSITKAADSALVDKISGDHPTQKPAPQQAAEPEK